MHFNTAAMHGTCPPEERFDVLEQFLRQWLQHETTMRRRFLALAKEQGKVFDLRYGCTEELVLFSALPRRTRITDCQFPPMKKGNCFGNAFRLALLHPELRYMEGWACMEQSMPTHHGWVEHPDGSVSDPTWLSLVQEIDGKGLADGYAARCVYMGVHVPLKNHLAWFEKHDTPNLMSFGEMMPREILEGGLEAVLADEIADCDIGIAISETLTRLDHAPTWELSDDGDHYWRTKSDGTIERWFGQS